MIEDGYVVGERRGRIEILSGEQWRPVVGYGDAYEQRYLVSNFGRVISCCWRGMVGWAHLMAPSITTKGYLKLRLADGRGNTVTCEIQRLVALAFIDNPENKAWVNHIDEDKRNNHVDNLEWSTPHENNTHNGVQYRRAETSSRAVVACDTHVVEQMRFRSACDAVRQLGSGKTAGGRLVTKACAYGGGGYAYGYYWWYADELDSL